MGRAQGGNGETRKYTLYLLKSTRRRNIFVIVVEEIIFASGRNIPKSDNYNIIISTVYIIMPLPKVIFNFEQYNDEF